MSKYDIFAISVSNLVELGLIFHSLWHMFPVRLIISGVLSLSLMKASEKEMLVDNLVAKNAS